MAVAAKKKLVLTDQQVVDDLKAAIDDADADMLAAMFCHAFGMSGGPADGPGLSYPVYEFEPVDGEYCDHRKEELK